MNDLLRKYPATMVNDENMNTYTNFSSILWRFSRPHTIIGSALAIPSIHFLAAPSLSAVYAIPTIVSILYAMLPSLLMNLYITGLNQITDVDIDKVNKPSLPIAAGDLSISTAKKIVTLSLITSLMLGIAHPILGSQGLNVALWGSAILGTAYSLEPLRLKRFPILAAFCIVAIRGAIINAGFYAHAMTVAFGRHTSVLGCLMNDQKCAMSSLFFAVFGIVIALMKDVPDAMGDAQYNIRSFTVRLGQKNVFLAMRRLITFSFFGVGAAFLRGASVAFKSGIYPIALCRNLVALAAIGAGISSREQAQSVNPEESSQVYGYYMHLWKLFYLSYLFLPFAR
jgi:homogentisate phytyltransferase/homogentisate geranylgeranyltransferase